MDFLKALDEAKRASKEARQVLLSYYGRLSKVREKGLEGLVSEADEASEKTIGKILAESFPEIPMLGEEGAAKAKWSLPETSWVVDPLDGTTNYVHSFPIFCISIGLRYQGELVVGVIDVPVLDVTYWACKGHGAFKNGNPIRVSQRGVLKDTLLATGFYPHNEPDLKEQIKIFSDIVRDVRGVRRAGAAAYDICMVAEGVFDAFWEKNLKPWDTAAGTVLVREAGGHVRDYDGREYDLSAPGIIASNPLIVEELLQRFRNSMVKSV